MYDIIRDGFHVKTLDLEYIGICTVFVHDTLEWTLRVCDGDKYFSTSHIVCPVRVSKCVGECMQLSF